MKFVVPWESESFRKTVLKISLWGMKSSPLPNIIHSCLLSSILSHISFGHLTYFRKKKIVNFNQDISAWAAISTIN